MTLGEILEQVQALPLSLHMVSRALETGHWRSLFKGQGMDFEELRQYQDGDDIRLIDHNVTARLGAAGQRAVSARLPGATARTKIPLRPWVRLYRQEREVSFFILIDLSASMSTGVGKRSRRDQAALLAAIMALSAEKLGSSLGALSFDGELISLRPAQRAAARGRYQLLEVLKAAIGQEQKDLAGEGGKKGTALALALQTALRVQRQPAFFLIISDFLATNWEDDLGRLAQRHDVLAIRLADRIDGDFPNLGQQRLYDVETGAETWAQTGTAAFNGAWKAWNTQRTDYVAGICERLNIGFAEIFSDEDPYLALRQALARGKGGRR